jgi:prepilin-type N-terminal cleavage/methylation domain-containing protein/prepilin-type processing-associated H-X9-DG protein
MRRRGFTLIELLVVIAILAVLTAILFPVFARTHCSPRQDVCRYQVRTLTDALRMYVDDYDQRFPPAAYTHGSRSVTLPSMVQPYHKDRTLWGCPTALSEETIDQQYDGRPDDVLVSYGYNWLTLAPDGKGINASRIARPAEVAVLVDSSSYRAAPSALVSALGGTPPAYRHGTWTIVGWIDGHVKSMPAAKLEAPEQAKSPRSGIDVFEHWNLR